MIEADEFHDNGVLKNNKFTLLFYLSILSAFSCALNLLMMSSSSFELLVIFLEYCLVILRGTVAFSNISSPVALSAIIVDASLLDASSSLEYYKEVDVIERARNFRADVQAAHINQRAALGQPTQRQQLL